MTRVYQNILQCIGNTPVIRLNRIGQETGCEILVKFEGVNPGGSIKSRTALGMIEAAEAAGLLHKDSIIVEPTSGNQGIGLAMIGAVKGYKVRIVMPESMSIERRMLMQAYGAELVLVPDAKDIGETIENCMKTALKLAAEDPNVFVPNQFANGANPMIHRRTTAAEILQAVTHLDAYCGGIGTGGTITGIGEILKQTWKNLKVFSVEPENAAILEGCELGNHIQMGIGDGLIPPNLNCDILDGNIIVTDDEAIQMARRLAREEGILCGISSGTNTAAAVQIARKLGPGHVILTTLADTGERYLSTPLYSHLAMTTATR